MVRNRELKTVMKSITTLQASQNVGGLVPAGMKRWFTFIKAQSLTLASGPRVHFASVPTAYPTVASIVATTNLKFILPVAGSQASGAGQLGTPQVPHRPNVDAPLFSIGEGKYCGITSTGPANVMVQYFDE
jgi:hypothetical protein